MAATSTPFSFANLIAMVESAAALVPSAAKIEQTISVDFKAVLASPEAMAIEVWINSNFTHVSTPGSAAILEPKD